MAFSSTAVDKLEALGALDEYDEADELELDHRLKDISLPRTKEARDSPSEQVFYPPKGVEQQEIDKLLIEETKASFAESRFQRAPSPLEAAELRECRNQVSEKKSQSGLDTDNNKNIYTTGIDRDNSEARNREDVAAEIIALQEEPVSDPTPSEPETQTSGEWGSESTQAMSWEVCSLPLDQEALSVASGNSVRSEGGATKAKSSLSRRRMSRFRGNWNMREEDVTTAWRKGLGTETAPIRGEKANAAEMTKLFLPRKVHGSKLTSVVHIPPIPDTLVQAEAQWNAFEQMIKDPDILKRLSSHPSTKSLLSDVDLTQHISVLRDGLGGMTRDRSFDLLLYDCMSKYGLCEALSLFGRFEKQSVVKRISELFYQLKSLEDGLAVQEVVKTDIESIADRKDSRAISETMESAREESPFPAQTSSEDFVLQSEKHGSKSIFQNATSLSGQPAITRGEVPALKTAKHGISTTGAELLIEEKMVPSSSPTSAEVVPEQVGSQSGIGRGSIMSLILTGGVKSEEYGTWWERCMTTIRSQVRQRGSLDHGIKRLLEVFSSTMSNKIMQRRELGERFKRLEWTCKCGHRSHDDFQELSPGAIDELANDMSKAGYITHAQISGQTKSPASSLIINVQNTFNGARRRISSLRPSTLPIFNTKSSPVDSIALPCLPIQRCRWLHMCLKKPPYATKLEPLHVCKDEEEKDFTDATFFRALRRAYFGSKSLRERLLFKLRKIEFVEFENCPENLVDHILPDKFPPTLYEYDFLPPPPLKKCPPIGTSHMMHLFTSCSTQPLNTNLYLRHIPKRREQALSYQPDLVDAITGWGLHFVESLNSALAVTTMFAVSLVLGIVFAICWCIWRQDVQGAFGVASYVTSVITLAAMTWQMWAF